MALNRPEAARTVMVPAPLPNSAAGLEHTHAAACAHQPHARTRVKRVQLTIDASKLTRLDAFDAFDSSDCQSPKRAPRRELPPLATGTDVYVRFGSRAHARPRLAQVG